MQIPDLVNGLFEFGGGIFNLLNVRALWGLWNLYYYPSLGQRLSFYGGLSIVSVNLVWVGLAIYFSGMIPKIIFGKLDVNYHGKDGTTLHGPKFKYCKLKVHAPSTGHRFYFYFPSGKNKNVDFYFDRRSNDPTRPHQRKNVDFYSKRAAWNEFITPGRVSKKSVYHFW